MRRLMFVISMFGLFFSLAATQRSSSSERHLQALKSEQGAGYTCTTVACNGGSPPVCSNYTVGGSSLYTSTPVYVCGDDHNWWTSNDCANIRNGTCDVTQNYIYSGCTGQTQGGPRTNPVSYCGVYP